MPAQPWQKLSFINKHPRDDNITFYEPTHTYTIDGSSKGVISGTGFLHSFFHHFDAPNTIKKMMASPKWPSSPYYGKSAYQIEKEWSDKGKEASASGTAMHLAIEQYLHGSEELISDEVKNGVEWRYFMNFWNEHGADLEPYRSEWEVWSKEHLLCGSIDMVFKRKSDGKYVIYDWKRSKEIKTTNPFSTGLYPLNHLPDCNYWHYNLQLNIYRWILENLYDMEVAELYLVICHPDNKNYRRMRLNRMDDEVETMLECRLNALKKPELKQIVLLPIPVEVKAKGSLADYGFID